jgi:hypothetical protein
MRSVTPISHVGSFPSCRCSFFDHGVVKVAPDGFGDRFIGEFCRLVVLARVHQRLDRRLLFIFREFVLLLLLSKLFPDIVFR